MSLIPVFVRNDTTSEVGIEDLGIFIPASAFIELSGDDGLFRYDTVATSEDLAIQVAAGNLVISDGTNDFEIEDALEYLTIETAYDKAWQATSTAPDSTEAGEAWYNIDEQSLFTYDSARGKWLGVDRVPVSLARKGFIDNKYLNWDVEGFEAVLPYDCTIVGLVAFISTGDPTTNPFQIEVGGSVALSGNIDGTFRYSNDALNINVDSGQGVAVFFGTGTIKPQNGVFHFIFSRRFDI